MEEQTKALWDHEDEVEENGKKKDIGFEDEEFELERGRAQTMEDLTAGFVTHAEMQAIIEKVKVSKACNNAPAWTELVDEKLVDALQVGYDASIEGVKTPLFNPIGECIVDIIL